MRTQEGLPTSGVLQVDSLVGLTKIALKNHVQAWTKKDMKKSAVTPHQPQHEPTLDGYQVARSASFWVARNALAPLESNLLKDWAATNNVAPDVNSLELELTLVKAILESTLGRVLHNSALEGSLMMLQDLVYDAEDVVDEMEYFRIQDMLDASHHVDALNLNLNVLPSISNEPPKMIFDRVDASNRMRHIVEQMQEVQRRVSSIMTHLGSNWSTFPNIAQSRPISISQSIEPKLYGREHMMKSIIDDITKGKHSSDVLTVIPIVGPGGIGKTTLAQHIYNSGEVQENFDVRVWTCVSLNFNVSKLTEEIQRCIPKVAHESSNGDASELIGQRLKNKRFLLVLDDIWDCSDEDEWKRLLLPFQKSQALGNIIMVTTRFPAQAQIMVRKNSHPIYLQGLDNEPFQELFQEIIFGDEDQSRKDHKFLFDIGITIAGKLKGSPLAAKTVGRLLKTQLNWDHWTRVLQSKEWEHSKGKNDIMPALKLSFDYLPSQLQQCFSYFALFPQDYKFERPQLINFWIGQEVLYSSHGENKRVEDIGQSCLSELVNYGFLLENKDEEYGRTCYFIHDLLHELARKVSSLECLSIDSSQSQVSSLQVLPSIRHLSINIDDTSTRNRLTLKKCVEDFYTLSARLKVNKLRTLMIFGKHYGCFDKAFRDLFREAKALRFVFLAGASYVVDDLLHNFYYLIHLRYLSVENIRFDFGSSSLYGGRFSDKISRFYHMKVLDAKNYWKGFEDRPLRNIRNLVNLRHFLVPDDALHSEIIGVGKLKSLQELRRFVVKQYNQGFELRQIRDLTDLSGSLSIYNLENIQVKEEAGEANLMLKSRLHALKLHWDNRHRSTNGSTLDEHVLERLMPSSNLQKLSIEGHRGATCPSWLGTNLSMKSLESLCLDGVAWATFPPIGDLLLVNVPHEELSGNIPEERFGNLRSLELCELNMVEKWVVQAPCQLFPFLEVLIIMDCPQLVELSFRHLSCCQQVKEVNVSLFPRLEKLVIKNCPQLSSFPQIPWNKAPCSTNIEGIGWSCLRKLDCRRTYRSKYGLRIERWNSTNDSTFWNLLNFHNLTELEELEICSNEFLPLCYLKMLSSLRILKMSYWGDVFPFIEADSHVKYQFSVEELFIDVWNASGMELTQLLTCFPRLSCLHLKDCGITGLGVNLKGQRATETPRLSSSSSSSANKVSQQQKHLGYHLHIQQQQQQQDPRAEDETITPEAERGMLLLPPGLERLLIDSGPELILCSKPHDDINEDGRTGVGRGGGLQALTSLRELIIFGEDLEISPCPKLLSNYSSSSFSSSITFPNSLERLHIAGEVGTEVLLLSNLTSLTSLSIWNCGDLRGVGLLPLLAQGHLADLSVEETPNFFVDFDPSAVHEQEIPSCSSKLQNLAIDNVAGFIAAPIRCSLLFSSLIKLELYGDNKVECFTEEQEALLFVNSLEDVVFRFCDNLQSLPKRIHGLHNLKRLTIDGCNAIQMLHKDVLPSSLEELEIESCPEIQSLPKDCLPDSLQKLEIAFCPAIRSLPEVDDLPSSLRKLEVFRGNNSEELKRQCRKWINIIPIVMT